MTSLDEAWEWYEGARQSLRRLDRLAANYWSDVREGGRFARDGVLRDLTDDRIMAEVSAGLDPLDDIAVFVLFAAFEAEVRAEVMKQTEGERARVTHPALTYWMRQAEQSIDEGSFFRILDALKSADRHDLIELVNQVRRYRNWVAHGRHGEKPDNVTPPSAYRRLRAFLDALDTSLPA